MISTDPNLKSYLPAEEQTEQRSKKKRKGHHHHSYDYTYYGRNNANEELLPEVCCYLIANQKCEYYHLYRKLLLEILT